MKEIFLSAGQEVGHFMVKHSPAILSIAASVGVIGTAVSASKATLKANEVVQEMRYTSEERPTKKDEFKATFKFYIPTAVVAALTITCIAGSNKISNKRLEALAVAYTLSESRRREYQQKMIEKLGEKKEEKIRKEILQDKLDSNPVEFDDMNVILTGNGNQLCYDEWSGRYFRSSWESLRHAENQINAQILNEMRASVNDFYSFIRIPQVSSGEDLGWNSDVISENDMDTIKLTTMFGSNNEPCIVVDFEVRPLFDLNHNW